MHFSMFCTKTIFSQKFHTFIVHFVPHLQQIENKVQYKTNEIRKKCLESHTSNSLHPGLISFKISLTDKFFKTERNKQKSY